ncbi:unnamed protein product, partial [Rotaria sp. Silwood2]
MKLVKCLSTTLVSSSSSPCHFSSAINPSPSKHRLSNNNTPALPSYAILPPRSRSHHRHAHRDSSLPTHDQEKHLKFLSKVSQNDTLQRRNCDLQLNNHLRLYQQPLPSDEQHASPIRASSYNALQPVT